ncbi:hypothetical protein DERP_007929 [Dermatophagoides pteronyssinus]|uniref:DUF19 domain-containing protein n=1 Tax=Dermatophagoides pteronyssinus TaxID=6956 RepID=A0ABQ8IT06_DERPT|nr:hypothetical protein DERP_007929 [Dermatophagoides pteronyssinus]
MIQDYLDHHRAAFRSSGARSSSSSSPRARSRSNQRHRDSQICHLKEVDSCLDKIQTLTKGPNPSSIITTTEGLNKLCGTVDDILKCVKSYFKKCGTPLQREIYDLTIEHFTRTLKKFCNDSPEREVFLQSSPCIHGKVLSTTKFKSTCNSDYLAALDFAANRTLVDERIDSVCCAHNTWEDCAQTMIIEKCGKDSNDRFRSFMDKTFGGIGSIMCPRGIFPATGKVCKQAVPTKGTRPKGKISENFLGKYLNSYLSFIITNA